MFIAAFSSEAPSPVRGFCLGVSSTCASLLKHYKIPKLTPMVCGFTHTCVDLISGHHFRDSYQVIPFLNDYSSLTQPTRRGEVPSPVICFKISEMRSYFLELV